MQWIYMICFALTVSGLFALSGVRVKDILEVIVSRVTAS